MKQPGENTKNKNERLPNAFELAMLASFTKGNLRTALQTYLSASEYLKTNGVAELALRKRKLSKKKIEAFDKLWREGVIAGDEAGVEYQKLVSDVKPALKLYNDKTADDVKSAIAPL